MTCDLVNRQARNVLTVKQDDAGVSADKARNQVGCCAFARPIGANQAGHTTTSHGKGTIVQRAQPPKTFRHVLRIKDDIVSPLHRRRTRSKVGGRQGRGTLAVALVSLMTLAVALVLLARLATHNVIPSSPRAGVAPSGNVPRLSSRSASVI